MPAIGLVLSGGGARGAYQAGALKGIDDILRGSAGTHPFSILTGISAGAINAAQLASAPGDYSTASRQLADLWCGLRTEQIFRTDALSIGALGLRWFKDLFSGAQVGRPRSTHLLDSSPLRKILESVVDFNQVEKNLTSGRLRGVALTSTSYATGTSVTYYDGVDSIYNWSRSSRIGIRSRLTLDHVLASSSIPMIFKPVKMGESYHGDGGIRASSPLSPAIHLGAERLLAIGVRYYRPESQIIEANQEVVMPSIAVADIAGVLLNSLFLDSLDSDHERMLRINETVALLSEEQRKRHSMPLRAIPSLIVRPSKDLGALAAGQLRNFPPLMRFLLRGLGASYARGSDLLSYISFDSTYTSRLVELGYDDVLAMREKIERFFGDDRRHPR